MKTEREFIESVYSKYELEKAKRALSAKRNKTIYLCASLAACFCFVVLGAVRILPALMGADSAMEADMVTYTAKVNVENQAVAEEAILYSANTDAKKSKDFAEEDYALYDAVEECEEVAAEAPMTTTGSDGYNFAERAVLSVADCSFNDNGNGYIDIVANNKLIGTIQVNRYAGLITNSSLTENGSEAKTDDNIAFTRIDLEADENYTVFLSQEYFSTEDIEKIAQYVEK